MRPPRVGEIRPRGANALGDRLERVLLADDALAENVGQLQNRADFVADHLAERDAGQPAR